MNKTSQKRRFGILFAAVGMICCFLAAALLAACNNQPAAQSGDEVGVYYYDDTDRNTQSLITLGQGCSFTLVLDDEAVSGTYSLDGETLTLTQTDAQTLTATLRNDVITLTYENAQMRFLKKLYFTVTFDTTGGSEMEAVSVLNGKAVSKPVSDPTREGYVFLGWYTDAQFTSPICSAHSPLREILRCMHAGHKRLPARPSTPSPTISAMTAKKLPTVRRSEENSICPQRPPQGKAIALSAGG